MAVLPEDPERALEVLGELAHRERELGEQHAKVVELRDQAIIEALGRRDVDKSRAALRMRIGRQHLYRIKLRKAS